MREFRAEAVSAQSYGLAEGPYWDADRQRLLWVDINAGTVQIGQWSEGRITVSEHIALPTTIGAVVASAAGELLLAGGRELYVVSVDGSITRSTEILPATKGSRLNDGACDARGRFMVGSLALDDRVHDEVLVRVETTGAVTTLDDDLSLSNGLAFTPDDAWLYSIDTTPGTVLVRSYDAATGAYGPRSEFLHVGDGSPDGLCLDADGNLWIAIWGAGEIRCFAPTAEHIATVSVPARNTSSVAFIGPELDTLLITTAAEQLSADDLARYPDSGRLFTARVGSRGLPVHQWAGPVSTRQPAIGPR